MLTVLPSPRTAARLPRARCALTYRADGNGPACGSRKAAGTAGIAGLRPLCPGPTGAPPHLGRQALTRRADRTTMIAMRSTPPFRADHVGSLLRPPQLLAAREDFASGRIDAAQLRAIEDEAIADVVAMQEEIGLQSATDGEFRRATWHMDFIYQLGGISKAPGHLAVKFRNASGTIEWTPAAIHVDSRLRLEQTIFEDDFRYLQSVVRAATPKLTIPSPNMVHYRGGPAAVDPAVYPDMEGFWTDLAAAYAEEVRRLAALGCTYLQLDDTSLAYLNDPAQRAQIAGRGEDADHMHLRYIKQVNAAIAGRPEGMAVTTHLCRGNFRSSWAAEGGYDFVAEALFGELAVDGFFLEYDDERSGTFEPLRFVPKGKMVVLGLVTTKRGELESKDTLKRRIDEAAKYVPLDQLCLSPQCGFSSTVEGNVLTMDEEVAKLRLVVETAAEVWG
jgi:5-methyltetrahydropteroyltriglutamate--homocysteine methyltransferase